MAPKALKGGRFRYRGKVYQREADLPQSVRKARGNGWADVGYHYLVQKDGKIVLGRPIAAQGAHARGANRTSVGICVIGDNTRGNGYAWTYHQKQALRRFVRAFLTLFPGARVVGHRDAGSTATECPGVEIAAMFSED